MTRYEVIQAENLDQLETDVNKALEDGWEPAGGVSVCDGLFHQAVFKPLMPRYEISIPDERCVDIQRTRMMVEQMSGMSRRIG